MNAASGGRGPSGAEHQRGIPHTRRTTDDRDEAERVISDLYLPNRLDLSRGSAPLGMEVTALRMGALTAGRLTYSRRVRLRTADAENFHVNFPLRGRAASRSGTRVPVATRPGEGLVFSPGEPAELSWSADCEQLCLMVPRARLEAELEHLLGRSLRGRLTFDFAADLPTPLGRQLRTVLNLLVDELDHPTEIGQNPHVLRHVEGLVLDGLLLGQPHSYSDAADREGRAGPSAAIRQAVHLLEERPSEPWTTVRLASEVYLSVRALQSGFRRDLAAPPMTYLRQVRLRRAREALQAAERDATTVGIVAARLGILHMSRFAAAYREAFGESPSQTLNRPAGHRPSSSHLP
jgi:AraC-like DNA-binding protein